MASHPLTAASDIPAPGTRAAGRPLIVEIVGPAGAGKTVLFEALKGCSDKVLAVRLPRFRTVEGLSLLASHGLSLMSMLLRLATQKGRRLSKREITWMITLHGWPAALHRCATCPGTVYLLDQASVFMMAVLQEFGPGSLTSPAAEQWWSRVYAQWAATLDLIIWLDAPDTILHQRIQFRDRWHLVKNKPPQEAFEFLDRYRRTYERIIASLSAQSPELRVRRINTGDKNVDELVETLRSDLGLKEE